MMNSKLTICALGAFAIVACSAPEPEPEIVDEQPPDEAAPFLDDDSARQWHRAGPDYPDDYLELDDEVDRLLEEAYDGEPRRAFGVVTPHAALKYSGPTAASAYARVTPPDVVILLAPKHHDTGASPALWNDGPFLVPGHALQVRDDLSQRLAELSGEDELFDRSAFTQRYNHPTELQLPFLSAINPDVELVPVVVEDTSRQHFADFDIARVEAWGVAVAELVREIEDDGQQALVVASTDLVHRVPLAEAEADDQEIMALVAAGELAGLHDWIRTDEISVCGEIVTGILMAAAAELGHTDTVITGLATSADVSGNEESVVGYGSAVIWNADEDAQ